MLFRLALLAFASAFAVTASPARSPPSSSQPCEDFGAGVYPYTTDTGVKFEIACDYKPTISQSAFLYTDANVYSEYDCADVCAKDPTCKIAVYAGGNIYNTVCNVYGYSAEVMGRTMTVFDTYVRKLRKQ